MSLPVERSITVSAPKWTAICSFSNSSSMLLVTAELPMLALILVFAATPMPIGSSRFCQMHFVGGNDHPPASDFAANQLRLQLFALGDEFHFRRNLARHEPIPAVSCCTPLDSCCVKVDKPSSYRCGGRCQFNAGWVTAELAAIKIKSVGQPTAKCWQKSGFAFVEKSRRPSAGGLPEQQLREMVATEIAKRTYPFCSTQSQEQIRASGFIYIDWHNFRRDSQSVRKSQVIFR